MVQAMKIQATKVQAINIKVEILSSPVVADSPAAPLVTSVVVPDRSSIREDSLPASGRTAWVCTVPPLNWSSSGSSASEEFSSSFSHEGFDAMHCLLNRKKGMNFYPLIQGYQM